MSNPRAARIRGLSLIELLVGMTLGLLVVVAAIGSFGVSQRLSASVSDLSQLQQQGSYALHVLGTQIRQAGSSEARLDPLTGRYAFDSRPPGIDAAPGAVRGSDGAGPGADSVSVAFARSSPAPGASPAPWEHDCVGTSAEDATDGLIRATFSVDGMGQLRCTGIKKTQSLIRNVSDFQVRYRVAAGSGMQVMDATDVEKAQLWASVSAIEVCLDLAGTEQGPDAGLPYQDCQGQARARGGFTHLVFHNVFAIRTQ